MHLRRGIALAPRDGRDGRRSPLQCWFESHARLPATNLGIARWSGRPGGMQGLPREPFPFPFSLVFDHQSVVDRVVCRPRHHQRIGEHGGARPVDQRACTPDCREVRRVVNAQVESPETREPPKSFAPTPVPEPRPLKPFPDVPTAQRTEPKLVRAPPRSASTACSDTRGRAASAGTARGSEEV